MAIISSALLGRLSPRFWNVSSGILSSFTQKNICDVRNCWEDDRRYGCEDLAHNWWSNVSQRFLIGLRSGLCVRPLSSSTPKGAKHFFIKTEKGLLQTVPTRLEAQGCRWMPSINRSFTGNTFIVNPTFLVMLSTKFWICLWEFRTYSPKRTFVSLGTDENIIEGTDKKSWWPVSQLAFQLWKQ